MEIPIFQNSKNHFWPKLTISYRALTYPQSFIEIGAMVQQSMTSQSSDKIVELRPQIVLGQLLLTKRSDSGSFDLSLIVLALSYTDSYYNDDE